MMNDDDDQVQVETREAQEAALLDLYNAGLKLMIENKKPAARCYLQMQYDKRAEDNTNDVSFF